MDTTFRPELYAIDFGTSNSLLAAASKDAVSGPVPLDPAAPDPTILRSVLYFAGTTTRYVGLDGIRRYFDGGMNGRLIRSIKKHLPSRLFTRTLVDDRPYKLEDLVGTFLREMRVRANRHFGADVRRVVLGRPARWSASADDDALGGERLIEAARLAGFEEAHLLPEPVAAAREFGAGLTEERVAVIGDFGGGTSDYTVVTLGPRPFRRDDVLALGGVAVAGDALDAGLMRHRVAALFGADVRYRVPMGSNEMRMPPAIIEKLCSPFDLSVLRRQDIATFLANVRSWSLGDDDRARMDRLTVLVDDAQGFSLFEAIETTKRELSTAERADLRFDYPSIELHETVSREELERATRTAIDAILGALDDTLHAAGLADKDVDVVCCTGGTARVPRIAKTLRDRFGEERVRDFKGFHAVVEGLARHAQAIARGEA